MAGKVFLINENGLGKALEQPASADGTEQQSTIRHRVGGAQHSSTVD